MTSQTQQFYDIHSHVLPKIDDGSTSWEETMAMVRQAYESGTTQLAITHHMITARDFDKENEILEKFARLKERLKQENIPLTLHLAAELYYSPELDLEHRISTYNNNGKYFLIEFPMQGIPKFADDLFFDLIVDGKTPILAHPERNMGMIRNPMRAYEFVQRGVLMQLNGGSLDGMYGEHVRQLAFKLLDARLVHFIGSDGHNSTRRPLIIGDAYQIMKEHYDMEYLSKIFHENPWRAMHGDELKIPEPLPIVTTPEKKRFRLLKKLGF